MKQTAINTRWVNSDLAQVRKAAKILRLSINSFVTSAAYFKAKQVIGLENATNEQALTRAIGKEKK